MRRRFAENGNSAAGSDISKLKAHTGGKIMSRQRCAWKGIVAGAAGGLAGTIAMGGFQKALSSAEERLQSRNGDKEQKSDQQAQSEESNEPATVKAAHALSESLRGRPVSERHKQQAGQAVHYAFGTATGMLYGLLAEKFPRTQLGYGTLFGSTLWAAADEVAVPALRLSGAPWQFPATVHVKGLAAHLVYAVTASTVTRAVRALW
jgi:uncharacterized membrane protein YagU involved in acid resistance